MCPRHIRPFRDSWICDRRLWAPQARLTKLRQFDPSVDRESSEAVISFGKGMRLRLTNGPLRPARIAARIEVVSPRPARIAARVDLVSRGLRGWN
ncbi:hypothetical protein L3X38_037002 [Prunus dulcis]|uniref:Uncharacterized protein n=1 Tax=Prunus dulcis TaxID=3755 RepID=A0AAD4V2A7_PRUDU|nr:hypothetical protein L3X38_037002 [Prunus dulcis]